MMKGWNRVVLTHEELFSYIPVLFLDKLKENFDR